MIPAKKSGQATSPVREYRRKLEYLYARKSAVDQVIASLEAYDRYRAPAAVRVARPHKLS